MARQKRPTLRQTCEAQQLRLHEQAETIQALKRQVGDLRRNAHLWEDMASRAESAEAELKDTRAKLIEIETPDPRQWPLPVLIGVQRAAHHLHRVGREAAGNELLALIDTVTGQGEPTEGERLGEAGMRSAARTPMNTLRQMQWREDSLRSDMAIANGVRPTVEDF